MRTNGLRAAIYSLLLVSMIWGADVPPDASKTDKTNPAKLIGHWKLAGETQDASGHGLHAKNQGVVFEADKTGPLPTSAKFGGRGEFLSIPHSDLLDFGTSDFSVSLWIHTDQQLDDDIGDLISKFDPATRTGFQLSVRNNTGVTTSLPNERQLQFGIDNGTEPIWTDLGRPGGENSILPFALAQYDGKLFAGTCEPAKEGKGDVYFLNPDHQWQAVPVPHLANSVSSLAIYEGDLYAGTAKYRVAGSSLAESENLNLGGQVFRLNQDQNGWVPCGQLPDTEAIGGMTVFRGRLYASSLYKPAGFFRYEGGDKWTSMVTPNGKRTECLGVYNGALWATGYDQGNVYRFDGETWTDMGQLGDNTQTYSFAIYEGKLCVATWPSGKVFRLGDNNTWEDMGRLGQELEVMGMLVHNGKLYAGTLPLAEVYRYDGGQTWTRLKQLDLTENVKYRRVWTMAQYQGRLVSGVLPSGRVHAMETGVCAMSTKPVRAGWRHIVVVKHNSELQMYVDGLPYGSSVKSDEAKFNCSNKQALRIGAGAGDTFHGKMSDVRLYSGALTAEEIGKLAQSRLSRLPVSQIIAHRGASSEFPENTLRSTLEAAAAGATCFELDVRRTRDGVLVPFHDATLDRTTDGNGPVNQITWEELSNLDVGSWKQPRFSGLKVSRVSEMLAACRNLNQHQSLDVLLDLKEDGEDFLQQVAATVTEAGDPAHTIIGVRNVEQAIRLRQLLPRARQLGLLANPREIEAFAAVGVEMIRLWPKWLTDETLVPRVRKAGVKLHLNGTTGLSEDIRPLMIYQPDSLSSDDPEQLIETLLGSDQ